MNSYSKHQKVVIIYKYVPQYRIRFFELLKDNLAKNNIDLLVVYGQPGPKDAKKKDSVDFPAGVFKHNIILTLGHYDIYWQPILKVLQGSDLIIAEQASKLLINYVLILQNIFKLRKVAFWGHGENFQHTSASVFGEMIKRQLSTKVHWWFAYNAMSAEVVEKLGFPRDRITNVLNTIDTHLIRDAYLHLNSIDLIKLREEIGLKGKHVGLYVGGMYPEKKLDFLLNACRLIRQELTDFEMVFVGSGVEAQVVIEAAGEVDWIHYRGPKFGLERVPYFAISQVFLMPGAVGLAILDCFALELPMITTRHPNHGPEIEYLENGVNGIMVDSGEDPNIYAQAIVSFFQDSQLQKYLIEGCRVSSQKYSIEGMVARFTEGVEKALRN